MLKNHSTSETQARRVLTVEDDPVFQTVLAQVFHRLGSDWNLISADNATSAIQWIDDTTNSPSLILVDIGLPDDNGITVITSAKKRFPSVPILVISVISDENTLLSAIRAGAVGYLLKAESLESIAHSLEEVLAGNYPISPSLARHLFKLAGGLGEPKTPLHDVRITPRERELLKLLSQGMSYIECAKKMNVALSTVQTYVRSLYQKLEVNKLTQAVIKARNIGELN